MTKQKRCGACGKVKPLSEFSRNQSRKDGYSWSCKECHKKWENDWRTRNREKVNKQAVKYWKKHRGKHKKKVQKLLGDKCIICGKKGVRLYYHEIHFKHHKKNAGRYKYILEHPEDFVPLCGTHHQLIHWLHFIFLKNPKKWKLLIEMSQND